MREKQEQSSSNSVKYTLLNNMSTEALKDLIHQDCFGSEEDQLSDDVIEIILEIILQREQGRGDIDVSALWKNFQEEYMPSSKSIEESIPNNIDKSINTDSITYQKPMKTLRNLLIAAILCLLFGNCVAFASGINLFDYIANWTEETFQFERVQDSSFHNRDYIEFENEIPI